MIVPAPLRACAELWLVAALSGCGATTVRVAAAPDVTTSGKVGFDATLALGIGWPLDGGGRSHHFIQAQGAIGGGIDAETKKGAVVSAIDVDYLHWAEPRADVRAGAHFVVRGVPDPGNPVTRYGFGPHVGVLPIVFRDEASWLVTHVCVGPELRGEVLWGGGGALGVFSLPLVVEGNFLAAGD